jgi:hypothetical protein
MSNKDARSEENPTLTHEAISWLLGIAAEAEQDIANLPEGSRPLWYRTRTKVRSTSMSRGTTRRTVRINDALWSAALTVAAERGEKVPDIIRAALVAYVLERETRSTLTAKSL